MGLLECEQSKTYRVVSVEAACARPVFQMEKELHQKVSQKCKETLESSKMLLAEKNTTR